jgi:ATP-dependent Clp protease ATP-binding subunit ClpA
LAKGIVVLDFIGEAAARRIVTKSLGSLARQLEQTRPGTRFELSADAEAALMAYASAPDTPDCPSLRRYGGRRIQDAVEQLVMDPVVEVLVEAGSMAGPVVRCTLDGALAGGPPRFTFSLE